MAEKTWNELTVDQRTYLDTLARAGGGWVETTVTIEGIRAPEYWELRDKLIAFDGIREKITPAGLAVWQQGQTPAEPDELARLREQVAALTAQAVIADCEAARVEPIHLQALRAVAYRVSNE